MVTIGIFINLLIEVLIRYHDAQMHSPDAKLVKSTELNAYFTMAQDISSSADFEAQIIKIIKRWVPYYKDREEFANYIKDITCFLKAISAQEKSFNNYEYKNAVCSIVEIIIDLRRLLETDKSKTFTVKIWRKNGVETRIDLNGLRDDSSYISSGRLCRSGHLINDLLDKLGLTAADESTFQTQAKNLAIHMCQSLQFILLSAERKIIYEEMEGLKRELTTVKETNRALIAENTFTKSKLNLAVEELLLLRQQQVIINSSQLLEPKRLSQSPSPHLLPLNCVSVGPKVGQLQVILFPDRSVSCTPSPRASSTPAPEEDAIGALARLF